MPDYVVSVRGVRNGKWTDEPGQARWLRVPSGEVPQPKHDAIAGGTKLRDLLEEIVQAAGGRGIDPTCGEPTGDLLVFVHGYNNAVDEVITRHRKLARGLKNAATKYRGLVLSFDWPSGTTTLGYLEDRADAKATAISLVEECIKPFVSMQSGGGGAIDDAWAERMATVADDRRAADRLGACYTNVHILAHSTGAFVVREAFDDADDRRSLTQRGWMTSQIAFIGGDISSSCMTDGDSSTSAIFRHCMRLTNYSNPYDRVLAISNAKRVGLAPRVGRVGLPQRTYAKAVNVNCGLHYQADLQANDRTLGHSWHFDDAAWYDDFSATLAGGVDRHYLPTRETDEQGHLILRRV